MQDLSSDKIPIPPTLLPGRHIAYGSSFAGGQKWHGKDPFDLLHLNDALRKSCKKDRWRRGRNFKLEKHWAQLKFSTIRSALTQGLDNNLAKAVTATSHTSLV